MVVLLSALSTNCLAMSNAEFANCFKDRTDIQERLSSVGEEIDSYLSSSAKARVGEKFNHIQKQASSCQKMEADLLRFLAAVEEANAFFDTLMNYEGESSVSNSFCAEKLDHYLATKAFEENTLLGTGLEHYLEMQYELTAYRVFGSFLAQRIEQTKAYKAGKRTDPPITRFSAMLRDNIHYLEQVGMHGAEFMAAKASFQQSPLSIVTLAKLAPFIDRSIMRRSDIYTAGIGAKFRLDEMDFRLLNLLVTIDEQRKNKRSDSFITRIESLDATQISDYDAEMNLKIWSDKKIAQSTNDIAFFLNSLEVPDGCHQSKVDIARTLLSHTILERDDMKASREEQGSDFIYYVGANSPWGSVERGTFTP